MFFLKYAHIILHITRFNLHLKKNRRQNAGGSSIV